MTSSDKALKEMEDYLRKMYSDAEAELTKKWNDYMSEAAKQVQSLQDAYDAAKASGDAEAIRATGKALGQGIRTVTINDNRYKAIVRQTADRYANVNAIALNYVNDQMANIYTVTYNDAGSDIAAHVGGYSFDLVDEATVKGLATKDDLLLPHKVLDSKKDVAWNTKQINSQLLQGILQGESIPKIAARLQNVTGQNQASAIRNARTMTTAAENRGRLDSYEKAAEDGVVMVKIWVSAGDDGRTRETHLQASEDYADGIPIDEQFEVGDSLLMYPGDPSGDPCEVYNCRCTMKTKIIGFINSITSGDEELEISNINITNEVFGVDINSPQYDSFSDDFREIIPGLRDRIANSDMPDFNEQMSYYNKAITPADKELVKMLPRLDSYIQSFKDFPEEDKKYHAEIFSVLSRPYGDGPLYRGESGEWVNHYGAFEEGKIISFDSLSFTSPMKDTPEAHTGVVFEFEKGTLSLNVPGQDGIDNDELILGKFIIKGVKTSEEGVPHVLLEQVRGKSNVEYTNDR